MIITVISAPDHAWGKIRLLDVVAAGIAQDISQYSYALGMWAYLEEDRDLSIYLNALREKGHTIEFNIEMVDSFDQDKWGWHDEPVQQFIKRNLRVNNVTQ